LSLCTEIDQMHQETRAFDMFEKVEAQTFPSVCTGNQAWDVGDHTGSIVGELHHAQVRGQRRKWIIGDFRLGSRNARQESRFASIWEAKETNVRQEFELHQEPAFFAWGTGSRLPWSPIRRRREAGITLAATPTMGRDKALTVLLEVP